MVNILIIGARGYGREFCDSLKRDSSYNENFTIKGFLDDNKTVLDGFNGYEPIITSVEDYQVQNNDVFVCALGDINARKKYIDIIKKKDGNFLTLIHPYAIVSDKAEIGEGVTISQFCTISPNVKIDSFTAVQANSIFGHDSQVGQFCSIGAYTFLGGYAKIGNNTTLHTRTTVLPNVVIGDNVVTGAGSVVIRDVKSGNTVFGVPAKKIIC